VSSAHTKKQDTEWSQSADVWEERDGQNPRLGIICDLEFADRMSCLHEQCLVSLEIARLISWVLFPQAREFVFEAMDLHFEVKVGTLSEEHERGQVLGGWV